MQEMPFAGYRFQNFPGGMPPEPLESLAPTSLELLVSMTSYLGLASPLGNTYVNTNYWLHSFHVACPFTHDHSIPFHKQWNCQVHCFLVVFFLLIQLACEY